MTSSITTDIPEVATLVAAGIRTGATGAGQTEMVLGGLAGVSPALAIAYLGVLVVRMLVPAMLIIATIRRVPAKQRNELLQAYLRGTAQRPQLQSITRPPAATDDPAAAAPAPAAGDHVRGTGNDE